jgi:hypothetical protein|tara:strand:+ start:109 stop:273 length:165 start_codon:yes stop_codon:yes gene_type:complete
MAILRDTIVTNGDKKTRQGKGRGTKWGTKPDTNHMFVSTKSLKRYKKRYKGQGR